MTTPSITAAGIQERIAAGVALMDIGDYVAAVNKFETARVMMSAIPSFMLGNPQTQISYSPEQLDATIDRVRRLANRQLQAQASASMGGGGIVSQGTEFVSTRQG